MDKAEKSKHKFQKEKQILLLCCCQENNQHLPMNSTGTMVDLKETLSFSFIKEPVALVAEQDNLDINSS